MWSHTLACLLFLSSLNYVYPKQAPHDSSWDYLVFTQHWPPTICKLWMEHKPHTCAMPPNEDSWTIHGIWPNKVGTMGPAFCNKTWLFDPEEVKPIEDALEQAWINIEADTPLYSLWAHEWNKHGTCAASVDKFNTQLKYFTTGLDLLNSYTMDNILHNQGIVPSDSKIYTESNFYNAIKNTLKVEPEIECRNEGGKQYLFELRICFSKGLQLIDCREQRDEDYYELISNCDPNKGIIYPEHSKSTNTKSTNSLPVHLYNLVSWIQWITL